jgi:hypothetical protein
VGAIITGQALGLFDSSLSSLGQQGATGQARYGQGNERIFVNAATGNLVVQNQDESLANIGTDFSVLRTYNSFGEMDDFGGATDNWRLGFLSTLEVAAEEATRITADGASQVFIRQGDGRYLSTQGGGATTP